MTLSEYKTITGLTVATSDESRVTAQIARTRRILEQMLGYTLEANQVNTNYFTELGISQTDCACPDVDNDSLDSPDSVVTAYRLFDYNNLDEFLHIDPFTSVSKVKLVYIRQAGTGITVKVFNDDEVQIRKGQPSKYLVNSYWKQHLFPRCTHNCELQLAVDAVWLWSDLPDELKYIWADMVTFYADHSKDIKSESILTHSYTKFERRAPENDPTSRALLYKYVGQKGSLNREYVQ